MKTSYSLLTIALFSLLLAGCQVAKTEKSTQKEPTSATASQTESEHATESEQQAADHNDDAIDDEDLDEDVDDEQYAEDSPPVISALFTEEDALWVATALETIEAKTTRLFLPNPNTDHDVILRYRDLAVFGKDEQRVLCGYVQPENSRMDNGKYFPFILEKGESLNISARKTNSAVFEHKWQTNCTLKNGRTVPLNSDRSGLLREQ